MRKILYAIIFFAFSITSLIAQDSTKTKPAMTLTGYLDSYYLHAFNNPKSGNLMGYNQNTIDNPTGGYPIGRAFDRLTDQFALGLVQTKFAYTSDKSDVVVDLTFGPNAELGNFGNQRFSAPGGYATGFYPTNPNQSVLYGSSIAIKQAYFVWKATKKLSFTVGQFGTHIGYEVIDAPVNYHYSLSNLFNNGPFYHVGAKANYAFSDKVGLMVGIVNNWDALTDWKKQKSLIAQLFLKPADGFNVYLNYIGGHNDDGFKAGAGTVGNLAYPSFDISYNRSLFDLTTGYQISSKFYLGLNAAYGWYSFKGDEAAKASIISSYTKVNPSWGGAAIYANFAISDVVGIGARYEYFDDKMKVRYLGAANNSLTITAPITVADGSLIIKPEFRFDSADTDYYEDKNGNATKSQSTLGVAFIYKY